MVNGCTNQVLGFGLLKIEITPDAQEHDVVLTLRKPKQRRFHYVIALIPSGKVIETILSTGQNQEEAFANIPYNKENYQKVYGNHRLFFVKEIPY